MSAPVRDDPHLHADAPVLQFERKILLSIVLTPRTYYASLDAASGVGAVQLTTDAAKASAFALYRVTNAAQPDTFMLQHAPATNDNYGGSLLATWGDAGVCYLMPSGEPRASAMFTLRRSGEEYHFQLQRNGRFLSAEAIGPTPTFFLAEDRDLFHGHAWRAQTVTAWRAGNMDDADLRFVFGMETLCTPGMSLRRAKLFRSGFSGARLAGAHFDHAECIEAGFVRADLSGADFTGATLTKVKLWGTSAPGLIAPKADFTGADFNFMGNRASLAGATLNQAVLDDVHLGGTDFSGANLAGASLKRCTLQADSRNGVPVPAANFTKATLTGAVLADVKADAVSFEEALLGGAVLEKASLRGASFARATLTAARLPEAVLGDAGGKRTDLRGAKLGNVDLSGCRLDLAQMDTPTTFLDKPDATPATQTRVGLRRCTVPVAVLGATSWRMLDLSGATVQGALPDDLTGFDGAYCLFPDKFSFARRTLLGASFVGARLFKATFDEATAQADNLAEAIDFSGAELIRATLYSVRMPLARFDKAILHGVKMINARLAQSSFAGARLDTCTDDTTTLVADLSHSNLTDANFAGAFLGRGQSSTGANFTGVTFYGQNAKITDATLDGATFTGAYLVALDFTGSADKSMQQVNFVGACLANCKFKKAGLQQANFGDACLFGADFTDADLHGAMMSDANFCFPAVTLLATKPGQTEPTEVPCDPTRLDTKATDTSTTCPLGTAGPCADAAWVRRGGFVLKWPLARTQAILPDASD